MNREIDKRAVAKTFRETMGCNCDLDNWEPERSTGHSHVCRIHKATMDVFYGRRSAPVSEGHDPNE